MSLSAASPTYFTVWLNNGQKLMPYLRQLNTQSDNFNDLLIVDSEVMPFVGNRKNTILDKPLFQQAKMKYPELAEKITKLESVYDLIKSTNPAAASDIIRFVGFLGLEGNEFIYHDVDVKIDNGFVGHLDQPFASAIIGTQTKAHLGKNWIMRAISVPTKDISLIGSNINNDLICVIRSEAIEFLKEYLENSCNYYDESLSVMFTSDSGRKATLQEIVTDPSITESEIFTIDDIDSYLTVTASVFEDSYADLEEKIRFVNGVPKKFLKARMTFGAAISQYEHVLQRVFTNEYYVPIPGANNYDEDDDPYSVADRKFVFKNLILRGETRGILNFIRDFIVDPKRYGVVSRKNNIDWHGEATVVQNDVYTVESGPLEGEYSDVNSDTEYEPYDELSEEAEMKVLDEGVINIDASSMFCNRMLKRRRRDATCTRNDPDRYTIEDGAIVFDGKEVSLVSRFVYVHELKRENDRINYRRYKFYAVDEVKQKLSNLKQHITARIERLLRRPSGKQLMHDLKNQYNQLVDTRRFIPTYGETSRLVRKFNRLSAGLGYATSLAFSVQFLNKAITSDLDIDHKIALGTIGSVGLAELSYISTIKLTGKTFPASIASKIGGAFKLFNVATAVYFAVDSSMTLSKNPGDLEAWWWLSRSVTIFTPLNTLFLPLDMSLIVAKQIVSASWDLSIQQNNIVMSNNERGGYHALKFFEISTQWTSNIQNGGLFKANIVNPTVGKLREMLSSDNYGIVGFPVNTICKASNKIISNTFNDFETSIDSIHLNIVPQIIGNLSATRIKTCLADAEAICTPRHQTGWWEWFIYAFATASHVQNRGIDMGVGCVLLDGTVISGGDACRNVEIFKQDIKNRLKVFVVLSNSDDYVLPFINPSEYNFNFMSVTNGSVEEFSSSDCPSALRWRKKVAPYILVNPLKHKSGRIDYVGVPAGMSGENVFTVIQSNQARVYIYKSNKNNRTDNFTVVGSYDNEFIVIDEIKDNWRLKGPGVLIVNPKNNSVIINDEVSINDKLFAENSTLVSLTESEIVVSANKTSPSLYIYSCSVIGERGSKCSISARGNNNLSFGEMASSYVHIDGFANITVENLAVVTLNITPSSSTEIRAKPLSIVTVSGLDSWTITKTKYFVQINNVRLYSGSLILTFQNYSIVSTVGLRNDTVIFTENVDTSVIERLDNPNVLIIKNNTIVEYFYKPFTIPSNKHTFAVDSIVNVTIPYQTRKQLDFYGSVNIANDMLQCGKTANCKMLAHINCSEAVRVCSW